ncbi:DUF2388 domain-containing protein [Pseudomonas mangrovi]|uniref:Uncharacterized protein n=1 Tax=Pseudomonas mangrovi TaxID=2161748 RepID=A0A2T5P5U8_9PSED|nr:DUF2388 domain-containing protein [Pseudomonas mangrovi]PTU73123.1 hypothetical protein DBO85_17930 [Pseudomonas mangrovi]
MSLFHQRVLRIAASAALTATSLAAQADPYQFDGDIPLTVQTTANGFFGYGANPWLSTSLQPVGTVLDVLLIPYVCVRLSAEETAAALSEETPSLHQAREDAAMHLASDGEFRSARLEAAFARLRSSWHFERADSRELAQVLLMLPAPLERTGGENAGRIARRLPVL